MREHKGLVGYLSSLAIRIVDSETHVMALDKRKETCLSLWLSRCLIWCLCCDSVCLSVCYCVCIVVVWLLPVFACVY